MQILRGPRRRPSFTSVATLSSLGISLVYAGVAFIANILMSRLLGPTSRGEVAIVLQWAYVLAPLVTLGLDRQALRGTGAGPATPSRAFTWVVAAPVVVVGAAIGSLPVALCGLVAATLASVNIEGASGMARQRLVRFLVLALGVQSWILGSSLVLYVCGVTHVAAWMAVYAAPAPVLLLVEVVAVRRSRGPVLRPSRESLTYMVGGIASMLAGRVDRLLLPIVSSTRQLGLYLAIATASEMVVWAARGRSDSRVSGFAAGPVSRQDMARLVARDVVVFSAAAAVLGIAIRWLLLPLLGPEFAPARDIIVVTCAASAAWCLYLQVSAVWLGSRTSRASALLDSTTALLTAVLVTILAGRHGAEGAALGCLLAYGFMSVLAIVVPAPRPPTT